MLENLPIVNCTWEKEIKSYNYLNEYNIKLFFKFIYSFTTFIGSFIKYSNSRQKY